jgi:hypothetical protein
VRLHSNRNETITDFLPICKRAIIDFLNPLKKNIC